MASSPSDAIRTAINYTKDDNFGTLTSSLACAATAFLVWDTLINFEKEVEYIWQRRTGYVKWLYLFIRHVPYLVQGSILTLVSLSAHEWRASQCKAWIIYELGMNEVLTVAVEIVLIVRVCAMYKTNKLITTAVWFLFAAEIVSMCTILAMTLPDFVFTPQCFVQAAPKLFPSYWTISLGFETTLFALTLWKFFSLHQLLDLIRRRSIMTTLVRDGTWAFAIIFAIMLLNTLMYELEHNSLAGICYFWELSVLSFSGSHVLLNLRVAGSEPHDMSFLSSRGPSTRAPVSELQFGTDDLIEMETVPG